MFKTAEIPKGPKVSFRVIQPRRVKVASRSKSFCLGTRLSSYNTSYHILYGVCTTMARGIEGNEIATPRPAPKKTGSSSQKPGPKQQTLAGFFKRTPGTTPAKRPTPDDATPTAPRSNADITPATSSLPPASSSPQSRPGASQQSSVIDGRNKENGRQDGSK